MEQYPYSVCVPQTDGDASDVIQHLIDENPNRTIFFPDGEYLLSKPICTPADPKKSVHLQLSNFAVLKAADDWSSEEAMVRLGGIAPFNSITIDGSNYGITGGIIDGNGRADGISVDSGRETRILEVSVKHTRIGIHIKFGANSGSSDADIMNVNIVGTGGTDSVGVLVEGYDNSFTNMRIANVFTGFDIRSGGNVLRNIHPLYTSDYTDYQESAAFRDSNENNWYNFCYSDQFAVCFRQTSGGRNIYSDCFGFWYSSKGGKTTAFRADKAFNSIVSHLKICFRGDTENTLLSVGEDGGCGVFETPAVRGLAAEDTAYLPYLSGKVI